MYTRWTQHLSDPQSKTEFQNDIKGAKRVLERLHQMIEEDENALEKSENDQRVYSSPNWSHLQAHRNGNRQTYATIKNLINLDQQKDIITNDKFTRPR